MRLRKIQKIYKFLFFQKEIQNNLNYTFIGKSNDHNFIFQIIIYKNIKIITIKNNHPNPPPPSLSVPSQCILVDLHSVRGEGKDQRQKIIGIFGPFNPQIMRLRRRRRGNTGIKIYRVLPKTFRKWYIFVLCKHSVQLYS